MFFGIVGNEASDINLDESLDPFIIEFENFSKLSDSFFLLQENGLLLNEDGLIVKFFEAIASIWVKFTRWFADTMQTLFNFLFNASEKTTEKIKQNAKDAKRIANKLSSGDYDDSEELKKQKKKIKKLKAERDQKDKDIENLKKELENAKNANSSEVQKLKDRIDELEKQKKEADQNLENIKQANRMSSDFGNNMTKYIKPFKALLDDKIDEKYKENRIIKLEDNVIRSELDKFKKANSISSNISKKKVEEFITAIDDSIKSNKFKIDNSAKDLKIKYKDDKPLIEDTNYLDYYNIYASISGKKENSNTNENNADANPEFQSQEEFRDKFTNYKSGGVPLEVESVGKTQPNILKIISTLSRDIESFVTNAEKNETFIKEYVADERRTDDIDNSNRRLEQALDKLKDVKNDKELKTWLTNQLSGYIRYFRVYVDANRTISKYILYINNLNAARQTNLKKILDQAENGTLLSNSDNNNS